MYKHNTINTILHVSHLTVMIIIMYIAPQCIKQLNVTKVNIIQAKHIQ